MSTPDPSGRTDVTEPISDEALALLREEHSEQVVAALPGGDLCAADDYYVPCPTLALLARLDAAEAERDAALARAVPDGWKAKWNIHGVPCLVPAPEEKP